MSVENLLDEFVVELIGTQSSNRSPRWRRFEKCLPIIDSIGEGQIPVYSFNGTLNQVEKSTWWRPNFADVTHCPLSMRSCLICVLRINTMQLSQDVSSIYLVPSFRYLNKNSFPEKKDVNRHRLLKLINSSISTPWKLGNCSWSPQIRFGEGPRPRCTRSWGVEPVVPESYFLNFCAWILIIFI